VRQLFHRPRARARSGPAKVLSGRGRMVQGSSGGAGQAGRAGLAGVAKLGSPHSVTIVSRSICLRQN